MKKEASIVFFGTDEFSLVPLRDLIDSGFNIAAVVTKPDTKSGRGQKLEQPAVKKLAIQKQIPVLQPDNILEIKGFISKLPSPIGVVVSYGKIIPEEIIRQFDLGMINIHPSLLPMYRGPSPIESAILNGDDHTGVTLMKLTAQMDRGPIYGQKAIKLNGHENKPELRENLSKLGSDLLIDLLPQIINDDIKPSPQDETKATYSHLINKNDGQIDINVNTATSAERMVRAFIGYPKVKTSLLGHDIMITKAHTEKVSKSPVNIIFSDNSVLAIDELIAPSGRKMTGDEFLNGYSLR